MISAINEVWSGATAWITTLLTWSLGQIVIAILAVTMLGVIVWLVYNALRRS
jgi:hypothetical protein